MNVNLEKWSQKHRVLQEILPFARLKYNPLELFAFVRSEIEKAPVTKKYFKSKDIAAKLGRTNNDEERFKTAFVLAGSWMHDSMIFANPAYCHSHESPLPTVAPLERREYIRDRARYGIVSLRDMATRFGITRNGIRAWVRRKSLPVREWKTEGRERFDRSISTMISWGIRRELIGRAFGLSTNRITEINIEQIDSGFNAPHRPTRADKPSVLRTKP